MERLIEPRLEQRVAEQPAAPAEPWRLEQVELAFALELQAESGVVIARASAGATFTATLTWQRPGGDGS
jgi:NTP-dependent ternary system trypsin peptidase co-occuring protein